MQWLIYKSAVSYQLLADTGKRKAKLFPYNNDKFSSGYRFRTDERSALYIPQYGRRLNYHSAEVNAG